MPTWTKEPPIVDGMYWLRSPREDHGIIGCPDPAVWLRLDMHGPDRWYALGSEIGREDDEMVEHGYEFWPVPLTPPE